MREETLSLILSEIEGKGGLRSVSQYVLSSSFKQLVDNGVTSISFSWHLRCVALFNVLFFIHSKTITNKSSLTALWAVSGKPSASWQRYFGEAEDYEEPYNRFK